MTTTPEERILKILGTRQYLGDGVYAYHDGYQIWLVTAQTTRDLLFGENRIALEPEVMRALKEYEQRVSDVIAQYRADQVVTKEDEQAEQNDQKKDR